MGAIKTLKKDYPWIQTPLIVGAPMRLIALADLAVEVSKAGGIGFIGAGTDVSDVEQQLQKAETLINTPPILKSSSTLPIGIGFINWGASLSDSIPLIQRYRPAAVWFFAPKSTSDLQKWAEETKRVSPQTKIWVQVGSVKEALNSCDISPRPDVLVVQGTDAGGHGLAQGAGIVSLFPEVHDAVHSRISMHDEADAPILLAAGGIAEARGVVAVLALGATGVIMGTRFLASKEAVIAKGYQNEVLRASDGGQTTVRTKVYDQLRGTTGWAESHNARGIINKSFSDAVQGMADEDNRRLYEEEMKKGDIGWGVEARMTTYAGSAVGLVKEVKGAGEIVREVREGSKDVLERLRGVLTVSKV